MPKFRTHEYSIWRACERLGIKPPNLRSKYEDNDLETQALILAYDQVRGMEDAEVQSLGLMARIG